MDIVFIFVVFFFRYKNRLLEMFVQLITNKSNLPKGIIMSIDDVCDPLPENVNFHMTLFLSIFILLSTETIHVKHVTNTI